MVLYKCKKRNMPNASLKTRRTDKITVCSEAAPKAEARPSVRGTLMLKHILMQVPSVMPSNGEGSAERLPVFRRGECNDTGTIFLFLGPSPCSCYCSKRPSYLAVHPSSTVLFEVSSETKALGAQHRAVENELAYRGQDHIKFPYFLPILLPKHLLSSIAEDENLGGL